SKGLEPDGSLLDGARRRWRARAAAAAVVRHAAAASALRRAGARPVALGGADRDPARDAGPRQRAARPLGRPSPANRARRRRAGADLDPGGERGRAPRRRGDGRPAGLRAQRGLAEPTVHRAHSRWGDDRRDAGGRRPRRVAPRLDGSGPPRRRRRRGEREPRREPVAHDRGAGGAGARALAESRRARSPAAARRALRGCAAERLLGEHAGALTADRALELVRDSRALSDHVRADGTVPVREPECATRTVHCYSMYSDMRKREVTVPVMPRVGLVTALLVVLVGCGGTVRQRTAAVPRKPVAPKCVAGTRQPVGSERLAWAAYVVRPTTAYREPGRGRLQRFGLLNVNGAQTVFGLVGEQLDA